MSETVKAAVILAVALILAAILNGGVYQIVAVHPSGEYEQLEGYRLNRLTGAVSYVLGGRAISGPLPEVVHPGLRPTASPSPSP